MTEDTKFIIMMAALIIVVSLGTYFLLTIFIPDIYGPDRPDRKVYPYVRLAQRLSDSKYVVILAKSDVDSPFAIMYDPTKGSTSDLTVFDTKQAASDYAFSKYTNSPIKKKYDVHTEAVKTVFKPYA